MEKLQLVMALSPASQDDTEVKPGAVGVVESFDRVDGKLVRVVRFIDIDESFEVTSDQVKNLDLHPSVSHVLQYFRYANLSGSAQNVSKRFAFLAYEIAALLPSSPEVTVALRKLLESKDAAVRASFG